MDFLLHYLVYKINCFIFASKANEKRASLLFFFSLNGLFYKLICLTKWEE